MEVRSAKVLLIEQMYKFDEEQKSTDHIQSQRTNRNSFHSFADTPPELDLHDDGRKENDRCRMHKLIMAARPRISHELLRWENTARRKP